VSDDLKAMTTEELRVEFQACLRVTGQHLTRLALVLQELESRGENVQGVSGTLLSLLRRIAGGTLLAGVVIQFIDQPKVMAKIGKMPVEEQEAIVAGKKKPPTANSSPHRQSQTRKDIEDKNPLVAAQYATVRDLADLIADMLQRHPKPSEVWDALCGNAFVRKTLLPKMRRVS